jgi:hypothetical protein
MPTGLSHDPWADDTVENMMSGYFESIGRVPQGLATEGRCGICGNLYEPQLMGEHLDNYAADHSAERLWQSVRTALPASMAGVVSDLSKNYGAPEAEVWGLIRDAAALAARYERRG